MRRWFAVQQRLHAPVGFRLGGTGVHGHEGLITLVLHDGRVIAPLPRIQQLAADKPIMLGIFSVGPLKPLPYYRYREELPHFPQKPLK